MRRFVLALTVASVLAGQAPKDTTEPPKPGTGFLSRRLPWKLFPDLKSLPASAGANRPAERVILKPGQPCAVPLLRVTPRDVDPKMILPSGPPVDSRIRIVTPPAPSCDDVKLR
jgi:hypothetical protein